MCVYKDTQMFVFKSKGETNTKPVSSAGRSGSNGRNGRLAGPPPHTRDRSMTTPPCAYGPRRGRANVGTSVILGPVRVKHDPRRRTLPRCISYTSAETCRDRRRGSLLPTKNEDAFVGRVRKALPVICEFYIHRFEVICLLEFWVKFKGYIFFMNLKKKQNNLIPIRHI